MFRHRETIFKHSSTSSLFITNVKSFFHICENRYNKFLCKLSLTFGERNDQVGMFWLTLTTQPLFIIRKMLCLVKSFNLTPYNIHYFQGFAIPKIIIIFRVKLKNLGCSYHPREIIFSILSNLIASIVMASINWIVKNEIVIV